MTQVLEPLPVCLPACRAAWLCVQGMFLLTGPNMAGKSTVLRSTAAVALLAACGLMAPASRATGERQSCLLCPPLSPATSIHY